MQFDVERRWVFAFIAGVTIFRLIYINFVPLLPQEAYYWQYAKHLALSYLDHPPLTAYLIAFFTWLGGDKIFFIRLASVGCSVGTMLLLYAIANGLLFNRRSALAMVVLLNATVLFSSCAVIITPDSLLLLFWTWVVYCLVMLQTSGKAHWWYWAGIGLGLALLSKYTAILILPGIGMYLLCARSQRKWLFSCHPYLGLVIAGVIFTPVVIWNMEHNWASFMFQSLRKFIRIEHLQVHYVVELVGSQTLILTPYIALLAFIGWVRAGVVSGKKSDEKLSLLFWVAFPVYIVFFLFSFRGLVKMNWMAPAHITSLIAGVVWLEAAPTKWARRFKTWFKPGVALGAVMVIVLHALPVVPVFPLGRIDTWTGWEALGQRVTATKKEMGPDTFIFSHNHKIPSEITFYTPNHEPTHAGEVIGIKGFQYTYWTHTDALLNKDAIFVASDADRFKYMDYMAACFERVEEEPPLEIRYRNRIFRIFYLYRCYGYKGPHPQKQ